jgi:hypothetical protein
MNHGQILPKIKKSVLLLPPIFGLTLLTQIMAYATGGTMAGGGTTTDPFLVADYADLKVVGTTDDYTLSAVYRLVHDIDASPSAAENSGAGFVPIGSGTANFTGTFHGAGHAIKNLHINRADTDFVALFGCSWTARIDSVGVVDAEIIGRQFVGGLVGSSFTTITNCYITGNVTGRYQVGGVVGDNLGEISNCYSRGNVTGIGNVGGVVGYSDGNVNKCYSTGSVSGSYQVGGVVGVNDIGLTTNCYSTGSVMGIDVGGVVGLNANSGSVSYCYAVGPVSGTDKVGGVAGEIYNSATVSTCYWNTQTTGALSGYGALISGGDFSGTGLTTVQMKSQNSLSGLDFTTIWSLDPGINDGYPYFTPTMPTSVFGRTSAAPNAFALLQNFPNPFNPSTTIAFSIPAKAHVSMKIFDVTGRDVATIVSDELPAGTYQRQWNAAGVPSGVYFYRIQAGVYMETKRLVLLK